MITFSTKMFKTLAIDLREFPIFFEENKGSLWNAKNQKVCLAVWQETEWAALPISCLRLPQPSLTSFPSLPVRHSQTKAPGSATPQLFRGHERKHVRPISLILLGRNVFCCFPHLYSKFCMRFPHPPWHEQDGGTCQQLFWQSGTVPTLPWGTEAPLPC